MIDITLFAAILLVLRIIAVGFLLQVLRRQWRYIRRPQRDLHDVRLTLFVIALVSFCNNLVPITVDVAALAGSYLREQPMAIDVAYFFSNAAGDAVLAVGWWYLYRIIERQHIALKTQREDDQDADEPA